MSLILNNVIQILLQDEEEEIKNFEFIVFEFEKLKMKHINLMKFKQSLRYFVLGKQF